MTRKHHTRHKPTLKEREDEARKKAKVFKGVLPVRFATKDVDGNDIIIDSDGKVEDAHW